MFSPDTVRAEMARRRVTLAILSEKTGLGVSSIHKMLRPEGNPTVSSIEKIAKALEVPVTLFFEQDLHNSAIQGEEVV